MILLQLIAGFFAVYAYGIMSNAPKNELVYIGFGGTVSWFFYSVLTQLSFSVIAATFISAIFLTVYSRIMAFNRKTPITIFIAPGFLPLAPGGTIFLAISNYISGYQDLALFYTVFAFEIACVLTLGMSAIYIVPHRFFEVKLPKIYKATY